MTNRIDEGSQRKATKQFRELTIGRIGHPGAHRTRTTNARLAGFTYLFYIALAFPAMVLFDKATRAQGTAAKLAGIAIFILATLGLMWLGTAAGANAPDAAAAQALGAFLLKVQGWKHDHRRDLLRRGQHALLVPPPARPDGPRSPGLARRRRLGPARGGPSAAARRIPPWPGHLAHGVYPWPRSRCRSGCGCSSRASPHRSEVVR